MDFLADFFLPEFELFAFFEDFEPFEEFADFVADSEPPPEEAAGAGECEWPEFGELDDVFTVGNSTGFTG